MELEARPFRPVLRGRLLTGDESLSMESYVAGGAGEGLGLAGLPVVAAAQGQRPLPGPLAGRRGRPRRSGAPAPLDRRRGGAAQGVARASRWRSTRTGRPTPAEDRAGQGSGRASCRRHPGCANSALLPGNAPRSRGSGPAGRSPGPTALAATGKLATAPDAPVTDLRSPGPKEGTKKQYGGDGLPALCVASAQPKPRRSP